VVGTFGGETHDVRFRGEVDDDGFEVELELNGLTVRIDKSADGIVTYDGFATASGDPTQMTDDDRAALTALTAALEALGGEVPPAIQRVRGFASLWSEFPSTQEMHGELRVDFRAYTSLCGSMFTYQEATHDDWDYDRWDDASTHFAYLSMHSGGPCSDGTYFWTGSQWECFEPDHSTSIEYAYGECFGRCGAGCGSDTQFTRDCLDHDSCVRFGHSLASFWCDDEFASTVDDWASAPDCL